MADPTPDPTTPSSSPAPKPSIGGLLKQVAKVAGQAQTTAKASGATLVEALKDGTAQTANRTAQTTVNLAQQAGAIAQSAASAVSQNLSQNLDSNRLPNLGQNLVPALGQNLGQVSQITTQRLGQTLRYIHENPLLKRAAGAVPANWLLDIAQQVDRDQAAAAVERLRAAHPQESPAQLAHRLMVQKTLLASGMGLASNLLPGAATALFALDLAATVALQVEMIYQIAMIYGLDLADPQREGEMLAIFGLAMGGQKAAQVGATYLATAGVSAIFESIPVAGALIGASTNAALNYAIGYGACRFYQAQVNDAQATPLDSEAALLQAEQAGEEYLTRSLEQQRIMDQLLAHALVMAYPEEQWEDIPKALAALGESLALEPEARAAIAPTKIPPTVLAQQAAEGIAQRLQSPEPLDQLLAQLDPDYALPLVARCQRLAQADGEVTAEEQRLLDGLKAQLG